MPKTMMTQSATRLEAPSELPRGARRIWLEITEALPADYFLPQDSHHLQAYVFAAWLLQREIKRGARSSQSVDRRSLRDCVAMMARLGPQLRLTASARFDKTVAGAANRRAKRELDVDPASEELDWRDVLPDKPLN